MGKRALKITAILLAVMLTVGIGGTVFAGDAQIVSVDLQQIFEVHPAAREAEEELQAEIMRLQQKLAEAEDEESAAFMQQQMQQELQMLQQVLLQDAMAAVTEDIGATAEELGYEYVFDSNALVHGGEDVTEEIMDLILEYEGE